MEELRKIFLSLDKNGDGILTVEELKDGLSKALGSIKTNLIDFDTLMGEIDKDGNGVIDYSEFITACINKQNLINKESLRIAFAMLDTDGSGTITRQELKDAFETNSTKSEELWDQIMNEVDKNGSGTIELEEFVEAMNTLVE